jgi:hypothetical protein
VISVENQALLLFELWETINPMGFKQGMFTELRGYIDESFHKDVFTFCGLLANGPTWGWFTGDWLEVIEETNRRL